MGKGNFCIFREFRGDIGMFWCKWMNVACGRLTKCETLPVKKGNTNGKSQVGGAV